MKEEIWKPIEGYEELYDISSFGRVRGKTGRIKTTIFSIRGVPIMQLCRKGHKKTIVLQQAVYKHFGIKYSLDEIKSILKSRSGNQEAV
jgi:hypothetical protein